MLAVFEIACKLVVKALQHKNEIYGTEPSISGFKNKNFTELLQRHVETTGVWTFFNW